MRTETFMSIKDNKVMAIAGYWEPVAHMRRGGAWFADDEKRHERFHSQEQIEILKTQGVTTVVWPGYKGLGIKHERATEWDRYLKPFGKLLERAGIELGTYLQCGSYFAETFYAENPQAREWTAMDHLGQPHSYSEFYRCYWRHRPCLTNRAFSEYVAQAAQILVKEYGVTYFYADNNAQMPCYTPRFEKAFRDFLKEKYATDSADGLSRFVRRYGHPNVDNIVLPCGTPRRPIDAMPGLMDPGMQDWCEFRCRLVARSAQIISAAAKAANPATRLCFNFAYDYGEFHQLVWGIEPEFMADVADHIMSEDANSPRVEADGRLVSHVHTCKHLRAMGRRGHFHRPWGDPSIAGQDHQVLSLMEMAVHNQGSLGPIFEFDDIATFDGDQRPPTIRFIRKHESVFTDNECLSEIAVLRSRHSSTINWLEATQARLLAQQSLHQAGFQWDNVIETTPAEQLAKYRLLVLPDTISVPGDVVKRFADYVRGGGRVLAVGEALACNEWGRRRTPATVDPPQGERDTSYGKTNGNGYAVAVVTAWLGLEEKYAERVFAFPRLRHPRPLVWQVDQAQIPVMDSSYHTLPLNNDQFVTAVRAALHAPTLVEVLGGERHPYAIPTLLRSRATGSVSAHVLNYRPHERTEGLTVRLRLPKDIRISSAKLIRLESTNPDPIQMTREQDGAISLPLPPFRRYAGVLFDG